MKNFYSKFLALLALLFVGVGSAWAQDPDWSVTEFSGSISNNSTTINEATWTLSDLTVGSNTKGDPAWSISNKKWKFGNGKEQFWSSYTISTDAFSSFNITKVEIGCYDNGGTESSVTVKQGSVTIGSSEVSTTSTSNIETLDATSGEGGKLSITFASTKQASYITSIKVWYTAGSDAVSVTGVSLGQHSLSLPVGKKTALVATVTPENATNPNLSWSSSNEEVATVEKGVVKGMKEGTATITVKTNDGNFTDKCEVTVVSKVPVDAAFYESFDKMEGNGGNDGMWSGITQTPELGTFDNTGWTTEGSVLSGFQCASIRKGTDSNKNSIQSGLTSPAIGVAGYGNITFNAQCWGTDTQDFYVDIVGGGTFTEATGISLTNNNTTAKVALTKKSEWVDYDLSFTGLTADSKFRFYMAPGKRGFLDEVAVFVTPAPEVPTFESLEALIAADQSYDAVNVTIDDEVYLAAVDPDMPGFYAVLLKNSRVMLAASGEDLGWKAGGKVTGTLTNVQWNKDGGVAGALMSKKPFWSDLTYTAPEVLVFNSIDELVAANLANGTAVTVTIEGTIKRAEYSANSKSYAVELDNNNLNLGSFTGKDYGWEIGGTVTGTLENVTYITENGEPGGEPGLASFDSDIFARLTYTAPAKGTLNFVASNKDGYWATFSSTKDVIFDANDVVVYTVAADGDDLDMIDANNNSLSCVTDKSKDDGWVAGYYVQAGAGVLVYSLENSVNYYYTTTDPYTENILTEIETDPELNMLRPASAAMESTGYVFYKLAYASEAKDALGFYWGAADGAAFKSRYGAAYLAVPASQTSAKGFAFDSESTGIKSVETSNSKAPAYNIAGQRVNANVKGIVIMNGKKYINK